MKNISLLVRSIGMFVVCLAAAAGAKAAPIIFNSTETAVPGEVIYLQGDNFSSTPQVWFHRVLTTDTSLTPDTQLTTITNSNQSVTASLPQDMPLGLYAVWVKDSSGTLSTPVFINQARATSFEYPQIAPYSASNPAGSYTFRIFGRNLVLNGSTPSVTFVNGANSYPATVVATYPNDGNVLQVKAPAGISAGTTYSIQVSNGSGHSSANYDVTTSIATIQGRTGGADPFNLGVPWASDFVNIAADVINVVTSINPHTGTAYGADSSGVANSVNAIQQALYDAGNPAYHANGATVFLPAGTYLINFTGENLTFYGPAGTVIEQYATNPAQHSELNIPAHAVLKGNGIGSTIINDSSPAYNGYSYFLTIADATPNAGSLTGAQGFTYNQTMTVSANTSPPCIRNCASNSSDIFFDHIQASFAHGVFNTTDIVYGQFGFQSTNDTNVLTQNCTFSYLHFGNNNSYYYYYTYGNNYIFRNNTLSSWFGRLEFLYISHLLIEGNHFTRDGSYPPPNYGGASTCGGIEADGPDQTILNNTFDAINLPLSSYNDGESILCQAGPVYEGTSGPTDTGTATSATTTTLTDSAKSWTANAYAGLILAITGGTGQGEWAKINSNTATVLALDRAWGTVPTSSSTFAIEQANSYLLSVPTSATSTTVSDTTQNWPVNFHAGDSIAIVNGPGTGQLRLIVSNTATTLTISPAWTENPGTTSHYSINGALSGGAQRWLVKGNTLTEMVRGIILYFGGYDCAVIGNKLFSSGGIFMTGSQRDVTGTTPLDRFDLGWRNVITDNVVTDPDNNRAAYFALHAGSTVNSPLYGTMLLGVETRRNLLEASTPNLRDNAFGCNETFSSIAGEQTSGDDASGIAILDSVHTDNVAVGNDNAYEVTTAVSQTPLWDSLLLNCDNDYLDTTLAGCSSASDQTVVGDTAGYQVLTANFSGTGTSTGTGGTGSNMADVGATGQLIQSSGDTASIASDSPLDSDSGAYLETVWSGAHNSQAGIQFNPIAPRFSWDRIFDQRSGEWLVNGGFDFFFRPNVNLTAAGEFRPIDIASSTYTTNGLRLVLGNSSATTLFLQMISPTGGGGNNSITGTIPMFQAGTVYHIGVTFSTDVTYSPPRTTVKIFVAQGTGSITTSSNTNLVATGTFALDHSIVNDTSASAWFNGGSWSFATGYLPGGIPITTDFDGFRMYYSDPGTFPSLDSP